MRLGLRNNEFTYHGHICSLLTFVVVYYILTFTFEVFLVFFSVSHIRVSNVNQGIKTGGRRKNCIIYSKDHM